MPFSKITCLLFYLYYCLQAFSQKDQQLVETSVTMAGVEATIGFLASDEMRGRDTPSPEQRIAARYLASRLKSAGAQPAAGIDGYLQSVEMVKTQPPSSGFMTVGDSIFDFKEDLIFLSGKSIDTIAPMIYMNYGSERDFDSLDVKGKIVVTRAGLQGGSETRAAFKAGIEKAQRAKAAGAVALVELFAIPQPTWKILQFYLGTAKVALSKDSEGGIPRIWMEDVKNEKIDFIQKYQGQINLSIKGVDPSAFVAYNVVGMVPGTDAKLKDEYVIYSGHYDHIGVGTPDELGDSIFNGTRDNAIGCMTVLEAAENIGKNPLKRSSLFIFFTGEEKGLLGSEWYVNNPLIPLKDVVCCFNSDNAGYNDTSIITVIGLPRTTAESQLKKAGKPFGLRVEDDPVPDQNLYDRSDQVNFARAGIPGLMFSLGLTSFDDAIMKYYHQQGDNPDSVDYDYLLRFTKSYVYACRLIGNMPEKPFWIKGDKYYEAGEALYGKK